MPHVPHVTPCASSALHLRLQEYSKAYGLDPLITKEVAQKEELRKRATVSALGGTCWLHCMAYWLGVSTSCAPFGAPRRSPLALLPCVQVHAAPCQQGSMSAGGA